jgi:hypothetical protein
VAAGEDDTAIGKAQAAQHAGILNAKPLARHLNLIAHSQFDVQAERDCRRNSLCAIMNWPEPA